MNQPLYGLNNASHDFTSSYAWGKNIFTNAFPIALAQYQSLELGMCPILVRAEIHDDIITTGQRLTAWEDIIGCSPEDAYFHFETAFAPYQDYTRGIPNSSDVVISDSSGLHTRALEIKLTTVPDSSSSSKKHEDQGAEIVARPLMVEQLAVSIAHSFGHRGRELIRKAILEEISTPQQVVWADASAVQQIIPNIIRILERIVALGINRQTPMVLNSIWRTVGKTPELEDNCFENFVWTDLAFVALFLSSAKPSTKITRPQRSLIWLVKMLFDYTSQNRLDALDTTNLSYGLQTDKAGSFNGTITNRFLRGTYLTEPRIPSSAVGKIIDPAYRQNLAPERRLDAALYIESIVQANDIAWEPLRQSRPIIK